MIECVEKLSSKLKPAPFDWAKDTEISGDGDVRVVLTWSPYGADTAVSVAESVSDSWRRTGSSSWCNSKGGTVEVVINSAFSGPFGLNI